MEKDGNDKVVKENKDIMPVMSLETIKEFDDDIENENIKKVEAALFLSARFLDLSELVMLTDINPLMIREILQKLIKKFNSEDSAIEIIVKEDMWKMDVRQEYVSMINKLATGSAEFSKAEQETLAVIAYKQPVKQSVIIKIRGNKAYEHIKHFIEIGLVISKKAGHTLELRLSDDFFEYFHLQKKEEGGRVVAMEESEGNNEVEDNEDAKENEGAEENESDGSIDEVSGKKEENSNPELKEVENNEVKTEES
jgi:segregation and condensation protein B